MAMICYTRASILSAVINSYKRAPKNKIVRLYNCKAWIIGSDLSDFLILKSYSTIVAAYQYSVDTLWVFGFYNGTTAQHVVKFRNWLRYCHPWSSQRTVKLYNDSRTTKRVAQKNFEDDFASVIKSALNIK